MKYCSPPLVCLFASSVFGSKQFQLEHLELFVFRYLPFSRLLFVKSGIVSNHYRGVGVEPMHNQVLTFGRFVLFVFFLGLSFAINICYFLPH